MKKKNKKLDKWFLLTWKRFGMIVIAWFLAGIFHNLFYALFFNYFQSTGGDEPFFFILAVIVIPIYVLICIIYSLVNVKKYKK